MGLAAIERAWSDAVHRHLPVGDDSSPWRSSGAIPDSLPVQGWKIHISATVINAPEVFRAAGQVLRSENVHHKAIGSIADLKRLNCGLFFGYAQVGKVITAYPADDRIASRVATRLVAATAGFGAPAVPFEMRIDPRSPVYLRYGRFRSAGGEAGHVTSPDGTSEVDSREHNPAWAVLPDGLSIAKGGSGLGRLASTFRAYQPLSQRGKGGVYKALDLSVTPARHCILKEGRRHGETDVDGNDGCSRLGREALALAELADGGVAVPRVYADFEEGDHRYLVLEALDATCLADLLHPDRPTPPVGESLTLAADLARVLADIHRCGWVWRDLKAANVMLTSDGRLRPLDFEGAARVGEVVTSPWGSPGHVPGEWLASEVAVAHQDTYALGAVIRHMLTRQVPDPRRPPTAEDHPDVPPEVMTMVRRLMSPDPDLRPTASQAAEILGEVADSARAHV